VAPAPDVSWTLRPPTSHHQAAPRDRRYAQGTEPASTVDRSLSPFGWVLPYSDDGRSGIMCLRSENIDQHSDAGTLVRGSRTRRQGTEDHQIEILAR
jgi:hypothetical protein